TSTMSNMMRHSKDQHPKKDAAYSEIKSSLAHIEELEQNLPKRKRKRRTSGKKTEEIVVHDSDAETKADEAPPEKETALEHNKEETKQKPPNKRRKGHQKKQTASSQPLLSKEDKGKDKEVLGEVSFSYLIILKLS